VKPNKISLWIGREHSTAVSIFDVLREAEQGFSVSTVVARILMESQSFTYQPMHNRVALNSIKIYIKTAPTCFGSIAIIRERTCII
jgi:hypothetical protein